VNGGQVNPADVVNAASDVLRDIENGSLRPAEVEARVTTQMRTLVGQVNGPVIRFGSCMALST
jgi:hypothetical protein